MKGGTEIEKKNISSRKTQRQRILRNLLILRLFALLLTCIESKEIAGEDYKSALIRAEFPFCLKRERGC